MKHTIKKVWIAGGTGFIGYHTALLLLKHGIKVSTFALPQEINLQGWYPSEIEVQFGDLFTMSEEEIYQVVKDQGYDGFVYALGPDERVTPDGPAHPFFHEKLVNQCVKICRALKRAGVPRAVILNSYFATFDRLNKGKLAKYHPYIRARVEQAEATIALSEEGVFDVMVLELPYIFGTMPERKPLWRDHFLSHYDNMKKIYFPAGGGTACIDVSGVSEAVMAALIYGESGHRYPIGRLNLTYKQLLNTMLSAIGSPKRYQGMPACLCAPAGKKIQQKLHKYGKDSGLNYQKLMTQIQCKKFFIDPYPVEKQLHYEELGFHGGRDVITSIQETMKACYDIYDAPTEVKD